MDLDGENQKDGTWHTKQMFKESSESSREYTITRLSLGYRMYTDICLV